MSLENIILALKNAGSIAILPHISADGDAVGSSLALALALKKLGKDITVYIEEDIPYVFSFLPWEGIVAREIPAFKKYDAAVALDSGDMGRLGSRADIFNNSGVTINIDHHITNTSFAFYNHVDSSSSSTGEVIYKLITMAGISIDIKIAECLYVAIATDTGGFRYNNTAPSTHRIAADLISFGINVAAVSQRIFDTTSYEKVKLTGMAINSLEILENGKMAVITVTKDMIEAAGASDEDCEGIVNLGRNIEGVEVAAMLRQWRNGTVKVSLRSNNYVDVSALAEVFGGGGHKRAAGCTIEGNMTEIKERLIDEINKML